jgi:hypothetical protein
MRREMPDAIRAWHDAHATFTTEAAWRSYLGMPTPAAPGPAAGAPTPRLLEPTAPA